MSADNKEVYFQIASAILAVLGAYTEKNYYYLLALIPIVISIIFWYQDNISSPIRSLESSYKELSKENFA